MKTHDVIIEQQNGHFRALIPTLPNITAEGATRDDALTNVKRAAQRYLSTVEMATVELDERAVEKEWADMTPEEQEQERAELIATLEQMQTGPGSELGAELIALRLQMLRAGQRLRSLDEINRELGRGNYADVP